MFRPQSREELRKISNKSSMKIAYLLDCFPVFSETFIVREIKELQKKYFNVLVYARINTLNHEYSEVIHEDAKTILKDVNYLPALLREHSKIMRWHYILIYHLYYLLKSPFRYLKAFFYVASKGRGIFLKFIFCVFYAKKIQAEAIRHIHVHFALHACTYAMLISKVSGIPYSFTVHAHDIFIPGLADLVEDKFNNAKFVVCISKYNRDYVLKRFPGINQDKITIVHCGIDMSAFPLKSKPIDGKYNILSIGRLVEHKGFKYLIEACKMLRERSDIDFICTIIGEGKDRKSLKELIDSYNLDKVVFMPGAMEQSEVISRLQKADIFVLPCVTEEGGMQDGIPVVLMEAMAMGIPVISTDVSGVPELIRDGVGLLVPQRDEASLSGAIVKLMTMSSEERKIIGRKARKIVDENFNIKKEAQKLAHLIVA